MKLKRPISKITSLIVLGLVAYALHAMNTWGTSSNVTGNISSCIRHPANSGKGEECVVKLGDGKHVSVLIPLGEPNNGSQTIELVVEKNKLGSAFDRYTFHSFK